MLHPQYYVEKEKLEKLIARKNRKSDFYQEERKYGRI